MAIFSNFRSAADDSFAVMSTVCPYLMVSSVEAEMEFLVKVFEAVITNDENRKDGFIQHGEVRIGDSTIMMGRASQ